jgi:hypothetical protein
MRGTLYPLLLLQKARAACAAVLAVIPAQAWPAARESRKVVKGTLGPRLREDDSLLP